MTTNMEAEAIERVREDLAFMDAMECPTDEIIVPAGDARALLSALSRKDALIAELVAAAGRGRTFINLMSRSAENRDAYLRVRDEIGAAIIRAREEIKP